MWWVFLALAIGFLHLKVNDHQPNMLDFALDMVEISLPPTPQVLGRDDVRAADGVPPLRRRHRPGDLLANLPMRTRLPG